MPLYRKIQENGLLVGVWKTEETVEQLLALLGNISMYEKDLEHFTSDMRKYEWLAVRVLLKTLCGEEKKVVYLPSGKPYLADGSAHISISHTNGYVAVALHPTEEVGIDIERYGVRVCRVVSRFVRPDEEKTMNQGDEVYVLLLTGLPKKHCSR